MNIENEYWNRRHVRVTDRSGDRVHPESSWMKSAARYAKILKARIFSVFCTLVLVMIGGMPALAQTATHTDLIIDGADQGKRFDGVGAISAGASTRLLYDYPEPERSQVLDYLFKPGYGASLQILKIEIGGDMNSTDGSESSHMRDPGECNCQRGYEWWLAKEARKRNPDIKLAALEWGAPGWFDGGFWSDDNISYLLSWLQCAREHGLKINYMGGWNESGFDPEWYITFRDTLKKVAPDIQLVAADQAGGNWKVATEMRNEPSFNDAVDIVGVHNPCGGRRSPHYEDCTTTDDAMSLQKPLWASEFSSLAHNTGAIPIARALNRAYIDAGVTGQMIWSLVSAWYASFPIADTGPIVAEWPWSGYYEVGKSIWTLAHTTQFTSPGWHYLDMGSRRLSSGATAVSLASSSGKDYSTIIETTDMQEPGTLAVQLKNLPEKKVEVWETDLGSDDSRHHFQHSKNITPNGKHFRITLKPNHIYSVSTLSHAGKGEVRPDAQLEEQLSVPFEEDFDNYKPERLARYFSDISGAFQTAPCRAGRRGMCYEQVTSLEPIPWHGTDMMPTTVAGDPRWWGDYQVSTDVFLDDKSGVELLGRVDAVGGDEFVSAYHLKVSGNGAWLLYSENVAGVDTTLVSGTVVLENASWHTLAMRFNRHEIQIFVDKKKIAGVHDNRHLVGQVGLRVNGWSRVQFDNLRITTSGPHPDFIPNSQMKVTATSAYPGNVYGYVHPVSAAIDDRPETYWRSNWDPFAAYPQSITIDLGKSRNIRGLVYQPQLSGNWAEKITGSPITDYVIYLSRDGKDFEKVDSGSWRPSMAASKMVMWDDSREARYLRLEATKGDQKGVTVGEIKVIGEEN